MPLLTQPGHGQAAAILRTVPNAVKRLALANTGSIDLTTGVTASDGDTAATDLRGRWVWLRAIGADVTVMMGAIPTTAGQGLVLRDGADPQEFYITGDNALLGARGAAACSFEVLYDTAQAI